MCSSDFSLFVAGQLTSAQCHHARMTRDRRFDGHFYVAVKTTGIFCRPICPAVTPKEDNIEYFFQSAHALQAGYRPCLRCRPDSAPGSRAWQGVEASVLRAIKLIDQGDLYQTDLISFAERLGISDRYLRKLFLSHLGMSPKQYSQYSQLMFAKQLLHTSGMSIGDIALACGFNSIRRFNDACRKMLHLTPGDIRRSDKSTSSTQQLTLSFRPPFDWDYLLRFYRLRAIAGVEDVGDDYYRRSFILGSAKGWFKATLGENNSVQIEFAIDDIRQLRRLVMEIRRLLDLDADIVGIESHLRQSLAAVMTIEGLRIPGVWSIWEAGLRAIVGQQISVKAAITQLNTLVARLGWWEQGVCYFPTPAMVAAADLDFLHMPHSRRTTLQQFAEFMVEHGDVHPNEWQSIKGIGPWTISYARLRGLSEPDCFLATDLAIKKILAQLPDVNALAFSPWGSYATFHCWSSLL